MLIGQPNTTGTSKHALPPQIGAVGNKEQKFSVNTLTDHATARVARATGGLAALLVFFVVAAGGTANALPAYAQKEGKACSYCHTNPRGGGGRNSRGAFYQQNGHSFVVRKESKPDESKPPEEPQKGDEPSVNQNALTVAQAKANLKTAEDAFKKAPEDAAAKAAYAEAMAQVGRAAWMDEARPTATRSAAALDWYGRALKVDPANKTALEDRKQILAASSKQAKPAKKPVPKPRKKRSRRG